MQDGWVQEMLGPGNFTPLHLKTTEWKQQQKPNMQLFFELWS